MITNIVESYDRYTMNSRLDRLRRRRGLNVAAYKSWPFDRPVPHDSAIACFSNLGYRIEVLLSAFHRREDDLTFIAKERNDAVLAVTICTSKAFVTCWARSLEIARGKLDKFDAFFGTYQEKPTDDTKVPAEFCFWTGREVRTVDKIIDCPRWSEIQQNYVKKTAERIDDLLVMEEPDLTGRVMLWRGKPGTGKTYAIRSLMQKWRNYKTTVVIDPEELFSNSAYLYNILMSGNDRKPLAVNDEEETIGNLIVMEDMPDLLLKESRHDKSHAVARLLNLTDGIIGQGLRCIFLFTTNEEDLGGFDPAFMRPGRCLGMVDFEPFDEEGAATWLKAKGIKREMDGESTLAELYQMLREKDGGSGNGKEIVPTCAFGMPSKARL
jgi:hypothetical protein